MISSSSLLRTILVTFSSLLLASPFAFATNPLTCAEVLSSAKTSPVFISKDLAKYEESTVLHFRFTPQSLAKVQALYHQLPVPKLVENILQMKDANSARLMKEAPGYFQWNAAKDTFMTVNQPYTSAEAVITAVKNGTVKKMKDDKYGIALITWFAHAGLKKQAAETDPRGPETPLQKISSLEKSGQRYLVTILDLQPSDVPHLKDLKKFSLEYLERNFGAIQGKDSIRLDFHFPYAIKTSTLHLHARVNMPAHPLELTKSFSIDEIITYLEAGKSVSDLILDRQKSLDGFHFSNDGRAILESLDASALTVVPNPYLNLGSEP